MVLSSACSPRPSYPEQQGLAGLFPDAEHLFGSFDIQLEKSRETNQVSEARISVEHRPEQQIVTLLFPTIALNEQVTLSFLHQSHALQKVKSPQGALGDQGFETFSQGNRIHDWVLSKQTNAAEQEDSLQDSKEILSEGTSGAARCMPSHAVASDLPALGLADPAPAHQDASALFKQLGYRRLPLPLSIKEASQVQVLDAKGSPLPNASWALDDGYLILRADQQDFDALHVTWVTAPLVETRYVLATPAEPLHLSASRIEGDQETDIPVRWRQGSVFFLSSDLKPNSWVRLRFAIKPLANDSFVLPFEALAEQVKLRPLTPDCALPHFVLENGHIQWDCRVQDSLLFAASYPYRVQTGAMDFSDWPELARKLPNHEEAYWDSGENLSVETRGSQRLLSPTPSDASRVCLRLTWQGAAQVVR